MATSASGTAMLSLNNHVNSHPQTSVNNLEPYNLCFWRAPQSHVGSLNQGHSTHSWEEPVNVKNNNLNLSHNRLGTKFKRLNKPKMPTTILNECYPEIRWHVGPFPPGASPCAPTWPTQEQGMCSRPPEVLPSSAHSQALWSLQCQSSVQEDRTWEFLSCPGTQQWAAFSMLSPRNWWVNWPQGAARNMERTGAQGTRIFIQTLKNYLIYLLLQWLAYEIGIFVGLWYLNWGYAGKTSGILSCI